MTQPDNSLPFSYPVRPADLPAGDGVELRLEPDEKSRERIAEALGLIGLRKLRFEGSLAPLGRRDWRLRARLGATVVQPCVVTLAPVTSRIDEDVERIWRAGMRLPEPAPGSEVEMPAETEEELLTPVIDLGAVLVEALALALPHYPRADGAHLEETAFTRPGLKPMSDEDARPFAGLSGLRDRLTGDEPDEEGG
jgi:uncharacterized metal-binding protein YceD (DUF177 family)